MGNILSWIRSFWQQNIEIAILGLQNAGKSTLVSVLAGGHYEVDMIPTVGFNMQRVKHGNAAIKVWDLGGQSRFRSSWERYCRGVDAILYVVDAADAPAFPFARNELHDLLSKSSLAQIPLLVLANKNDLTTATDLETTIEALALRKLNDREVAYYSISCKQQKNIDAVLKWLVKHSK